MNKRIYIIGSVASRKNPLAKKLSKKLNINYYSLDNIVWSDNNNQKKYKKEVDKLFKTIF